MEMWNNSVRPEGCKVSTRCQSTFLVQLNFNKNKRERTKTGFAGLFSSVLPNMSALGVNTGFKLYTDMQSTFYIQYMLVICLFLLNKYYHWFASVMPCFSPCRQWTCTTTMSQTQTTTAAPATTVSHQLLSVLFCIPPLRFVFLSLPSIFSQPRLQSTNYHPSFYLSPSSLAVSPGSFLFTIGTSVYFLLLSHHSSSGYFSQACCFLIHPNLLAVLQVIQPAHIHIHLTLPLGCLIWPLSSEDNDCCP